LSSEIIRSKLKVMDIRKFFDSPTTSKASPVSNMLGKEKAAAKEPKKQKATAASGSATAAELRQAKKIVAAAAKAKKEKEDENFYCPQELVEWKKAGMLRKKLRDINTEGLKVFCRASNLKYGGAKYKLVASLLEHVEEALKREKMDTLQALADDQDVSAAAELHFAKVKSFSAACNLFDKHFAKLNKQHPTVAEQLRVMIGLTRGFDSLLLKAITGPSCSQYNGKYGERGMDGQNKVSEAWRGFLTEQGKSLSEEDWKMAVDFLFKELPTAAYGFPAYGEHGFDGFEETGRGGKALSEAQKEVWAASKF